MKKSTPVKIISFYSITGLHFLNKNQFNLEYCRGECTNLEDVGYDWGAANCLSTRNRRVNPLTFPNGKPMIVRVAGSNPCEIMFTCDRTKYNAVYFVFTALNSQRRFCGALTVDNFETCNGDMTCNAASNGYRGCVPNYKYAAICVNEPP